MRHLKRSVLSLLMAILASCKYPVKKTDPTVIDFALDTCDRLKVIDDKPEIKVEYVGETKKISMDCFKELIAKHKTTEFIVLPINQAMEMKRAYESQHQRNDKNE